MRVRPSSILAVAGLLLTTAAPTTLTAGETELLSVNSTGRQGNGPSLAPSITGDGRFVAFDSEATNLVARDRCPAARRPWRAR